MPRWWSVRELIGAFLHLRDSVVLRRSEYRLDKVAARRHLVAGLMKIHLDIDAAVAVIRGSDTVDDARQGLQARFAIDEEQANYVLALQLRRLTKLDVIELQAEADKLDAEFTALTELVSNPDARRKVIDQELVETAKLFKGPEFDRRTILDFEATPVTSASDEDGPRERKVDPAWRLDDRGVFSDSHGDLLTSGLGWAVWTDGRIKFTTGSGLPYKIRDIPVAPDIVGLVRSGVLADGHHLALVTRRGCASVSIRGRRTNAAIAPSSAMRMANAPGARSAGTVDPSHSTKPTSSPIRSRACASTCLKFARRVSALNAYLPWIRKFRGSTRRSGAPRQPFIGRHARPCAGHLAWNGKAVPHQTRWPGQPSPLMAARPAMTEVGARDRTKRAARSQAAVGAPWVSAATLRIWATSLRAASLWVNISSVSVSSSATGVNARSVYGPGLRHCGAPAAPCARDRSNA